MIKTYSYKLYNNKLRNKKLITTLRICCHIYNHCIELHQKYYKLTGKHLHKYKLQKHITKLKKKPRYSHWNKVNSQTIQDITERIEKGYQAFFKKQHKRTPHFRSHRKYKSFTLKQTGYKLFENKIQIGKQEYRFFKDRTPKGKVKTITIKQDTLGDVYVFVSCEVEVTQNRVKTGKTAGFDFGLKTFLTTSDNEQIESPEYLKNSLSTLKQLSKGYSKKQKGSNNKERSRLNLNRCYQKISNQRRDFHFKLANLLASKYDELYFEDLNIESMKKLWGRKISDLAFSDFLKILEYICEREGCKLTKIDRFYPSSKLCNNCGYKNKELQLSDREWKCPQCGQIIDRDLNAAKNIKQVGASTCREVEVNLSFREFSAYYEYPRTRSSLNFGVCQIENSAHNVALLKKWQQSQ